ncbi:MAG: hypothetical protein O7I42_25915 [Alphaproteobacteria bacterium]|nr:hypothetical protein [Alphaproteobacteria bacterium]
MALRISIVIPSLNGTTLPRALDAIADQLGNRTKSLLSAEMRPAI